MSCSGRYAEATDYNNIVCADLDLDDPENVTAINSALDAAAGEIAVSIAAANSCNCALSSGAVQYLKRLNVILAALNKFCPCMPSLTADDRIEYREWSNDQLKMIRTGQIPLCDGDTGSDAIAFGWAENNLTPWSSSEIIFNRRLRNQ